MSKDNPYDIKYMVLWSVSLDSNRVVRDVTLHQIIDMNEFENNNIEFRPSDLFIKRAKEQIIKMDWSSHKQNTSDASAYSYVYRSNPDLPQSSNDDAR